MNNLENFRWTKRSVALISGHLRSIRDRRGILTREIVLEEARSTNSPLHSFFTWDDAEAAEAWRLEQAGALLRVCKVRVTVRGVEQPVREFVNVVEEGISQYKPLEVVQRDADLSDQVVDKAREELVSWLRRYNVYSAVLPLANRIREALQEAEKVQS